MSPRSIEISRKMREKSRKAILSASLELFATSGYSATTTDAIAKKAGISKGLIFTHFKKKQDILFAIFDEQFASILPRFITENDRRPAKEKVVALIDTWLDVIKTNPLAVRLSLQLNLDDEYRKILRSKKTMEYFENFLSAMVKTIKDAGSKKPELDTYLLMFLFDGIVANYTVAPELFPIDAIKDHFVGLLSSGWKSGEGRR
ncbi:MAG TPA: TetR/AcrR family transcriptional regulator [Bacteroidota bacterium]|nr:TetR/AcrR family transcriptional regulator [Bacteroidota bacterium]